MLEQYQNHNLFKSSPEVFAQSDPHLSALTQLKFAHSSNWWSALSLETPGIYILTGGRQIGKSTSCKQLILHALSNSLLSQHAILYLPCDEIYDALALSRVLDLFFDSVEAKPFLLIIDEVTFVQNWDRVIKAKADAGLFKKGVCILTGSDTLILKEAQMRFPGRRGNADIHDFHLYPLSFREYVNLVAHDENPSDELLFDLFKTYGQCGGYLRAINDLHSDGKIARATYLTYEQWLRGDFLRQGKNEDYLLNILKALITVGVSPISYSKLTQKIGLLSKDTCIDYMNILERMDVLMHLQSFDQNKKQGFPRKDRKFHFTDPFIQHTIYQWLHREGYLNSEALDSTVIEAAVASHCARIAPSYYFSAKGEVDVVMFRNKVAHAIEVKWAEQIRPSDLKTLKVFSNATILTKRPVSGAVDNIKSMPVYRFLFELA